MVKRIAIAMTGIAMGATMLAAPAHADDYKPDPQILWVGVTPSVAVVGKHRPVRVTATVKTKDVKSAKIEIWEPKSGHWGDHWSARRTEEPLTGPKWDFWKEGWTFDWNHKVGSWKVHVEVVGYDGTVKTADRVVVVKHEEYRPPAPKTTRIAGFDATPEPVRKGRKLALAGELKVDRWNYRHDDRWVGYQDLGVYFLPKGSYRWKYVATIETNADGSFWTKVRALKSGTWGVRFAGAHGLRASEAYDYVKVVRH
jgi:hypothetical protein